MSRRSTVLPRVLALVLAGACPVALSACRDDGGAGGDAGAATDGATADAPPSAHPGEVWVMTWNIQLFPKSASTAARVAQILESMPVDLVAVQEIDDAAAFMQLDDALPSYTAVLANDAFNDTRVGIIYRTATVTLDGVETLFVDDSYAFPRSPLKVHASAQGIDFTVLVLHLKALSGNDNEARRRDAVTKLDAWVDLQLAGTGDRDIVILGDWNDELTDPAVDNIFQPMLDQPGQYTFLTLPLAQMEQQTGGTYIPFDSFIDHILITEDALAEWGAGATSVVRIDDTDPQYESTISDHRPVLTKFRPGR